MNIVKTPNRMADAVPASADVDPLATPAGEVDTRFPRLQPDRVYRLTISATKEVSDKGNDMIVCKLQTTKDEVDTDGRTLHTGFPVFHRIMVTPTDKRTVKDIARDCALLLKAIGKSNITPKQLIDDPTTILNGQLVDAKIGIQKAKDGFPEANVVSSFVIPQ